MAISKSLLGYLFVLCVALQSVAALKGEVVVYWGQGPSAEQPLQHYCQDSTYDSIVLAFVHDWPLSDGDSYPSMEINYCSKAYPGHPNLLQCPGIAADITYCQSKGKKIFLSFGGSGGSYGFTSISQAQTFATLVWNTFLGGNGPVRPFGSVIVDGIDLDVEHGNAIGYAEFITQLRTYFVGAPRAYYIASAPQCPYPDDWMGPGQGLALTNAWFDYVWVQFYNNNCGVDRYPGTKFNFNTWANWAKTISVNKNVKVLIGAPSSSDSAGTGYVSASTLQTISQDMYNQFPTVFGGIMLWEAGRAEKNSNFGAQIAAFLHTGAPNPPPAAPVTTAAVTTGQKASPPITSGKPAPITSGKPAPITSGKPAPAPAVTTGKTKSGSSSQPASNPPPPTISLPPTSSSCIEGHMICASSETYRTCTHGGWASPQSCQRGLTCTPVGVYIYCM